jgi:hypothetical protein
LTDARKKIVDLEKNSEYTKVSHYSCMWNTLDLSYLHITPFSQTNWLNYMYKVDKIFNTYTAKFKIVLYSLPTTTTSSGKWHKLDIILMVVLLKRMCKIYKNEHSHKQLGSQLDLACKKYELKHEFDSFKNVECWAESNLELNVLAIMAPTWSMHASFHSVIHQQGRPTWSMDVCTSRVRPATTG